MRPHLLVATDFSLPAQKLTRSLGHFQNYGADKITLVHVRPTSPLWSFSQEEKHFARQRLEEVADDLRSGGWSVEIQNVSGRPGTQIVSVAAKVQADLIVLANQGHGAASEVVLGSVAADVLERARRPVFLFCADAVDDSQDLATTPMWDRIICPVDFSEPSMDALQWAIEIATTEWTPMVLLHAVDDRFHSDREAKRRRDELEKRRDELRERGISDLSIQVVTGHPKKVVAEAGDHYPGALFVMGSHGRGWLGDLMLGGVSRSVARRGTHHALFVPGE